MADNAYGMVADTATPDRITVQRTFSPHPSSGDRSLSPIISSDSEEPSTARFFSQSVELPLIDSPRPELLLTTRNWGALNRELRLPLAHPKMRVLRTSQPGFFAAPCCDHEHVMLGLPMFGRRRLCQNRDLAERKRRERGFLLDFAKPRLGRRFVWSHSPPTRSQTLGKKARSDRR